MHKVAHITACVDQHFSERVRKCGAYRSCVSHSNVLLEAFGGFETVSQRSGEHYSVTVPTWNRTAAGSPSQQASICS